MSTLRLQLFGTVQIETERKKIIEEEFHSGKLVQLLAYMSLNRDRDVPSEELISIFCRETEPQKMASSVRNMVCRLRSVLKPLRTREVILTVNRGYRWNPDVTVDVDLEQFEAWAMKVLRTENEEELWIEQEKFKSVPQKSLAEKLKRIDWFRRKDEACQKLQRAVRTHFERAGEEQELQIEPQIGNYVRSMQSVIAEIADTEPPRGAYVCNYEMFRGIFHLEVRSLERRSEKTDKSSFAMLLTLQYKGTEDKFNAFVFKENMKFVGQAMSRFLRYNDVISQCGPSQYIVILHNCYERDAEIVKNRIREKTNVYLRQTTHALECEIQDMKECRRDIV